MSSRRHSTSYDLCTGSSLPCNADQCRTQINDCMLRMLHMCACNIKTKKNGNWLGPVMDLFGRLLDLSLENNAFPAALMDLFQKNSSRLIKLIVTARPNLSWHYGTWRKRYVFQCKIILFPKVNKLSLLQYLTIVKKKKKKPLTFLLLIINRFF